MESFSSSYHHNKSLNGAPLGRIVMTGPKIMYRNREYTSASEALVDYINEFEGNRRKFKASNSRGNSKDVRDLLSTRSTQRQDRTDLPQQASGAFQEPIDLSRLSLRELRLSSRPIHNGSNDTLQVSAASIEESYRRMMAVDDAIEVAHTLNQSYDVLKTVEEDRLSNVGEVPSRSDLQSLATESLISVDPYPENNEEIPAPAQLPQPRSGHIYSYRSPRSRAHTVTGVTFRSRTNGLIANSKVPTLKSDAVIMVNREFGNTDNKPVLGGSLPDARQGRQPSENKSNFTSTPRFRSRSVSPSFDNGKFYPRRRPPSWLEDLDISRESRQSNMANFNGLHTRRTPSWIEDIMGSSTSSVTQSGTGNVTRMPETFTASSSSIISDSKTSSSNLDPVLRASDLDIAADFSSGRSGKQRSNSAYVHTSTPLKKSSVRTDKAKYGAQANHLPDRFRLSDTCNIDGRTVSSISTSDSRLSRNIESNADMHVDSAENNDKIGKMLKELDVIKTKLKSSSDDTHNCIRELTSAQGGDKSVITTKSNPEGPSHVRHLSGEDTCSPAASPRRQNNTQGTCTSSSANPDLKVKSFTSVLADDILHEDRPWERQPVPLHEDVLVYSEREPVEDREVYGSRNPGVIGDFLNDCLNKHNKEPAQKQSHDTLSGGSQPGSMEALKNMLFKLQSEASINQDNKNEERDMALQGRQLQVKSSKTDVEHDSVLSVDPVRALEDNDFQTGPGAQSLEKALVHLSRLKTLVQGSAFNPESRNKSTPSASSSSS